MSLENSELALSGKIEATPELLARLWWEMSSDEHAKFYAELSRITASNQLEVQAIYIREACEEHSYEALKAFQSIGAMAFKFGGLGEHLGKWDLPESYVRAALSRVKG